MKAEQQYIDLFSQCEAMICRHSAEVLNAPRAKAFADFERLGFPTRKQEKYKYTEVSKYFAPRLRTEPESSGVSGQSVRSVQVRCSEYEHFPLFCGKRCI